MVKGYEFAKDHYVTFTPEELKALDEIADADHRHRRVRAAAEVDPVYFDRAYYLGPDKGGGKAYRLLALALEQAGKAAARAATRRAASSTSCSSAPATGGSSCSSSTTPTRSARSTRSRSTTPQSKEPEVAARAAAHRADRVRRGSDPRPTRTR